MVEDDPDADNEQYQVLKPSLPKVHDSMKFCLG